MREFIAQLIYWLPLIVIFIVWLAFSSGAARRQKSMAEIGRENTEAVKQNTEALKALLAKLDSQSKQ
ncbi:hypothetical protein [Mesorhizobium neociceri]|uniref:Uncharacterized protein n=1 Tax=Mesorhizobium neociceri TaxID=1307853 RepID=A0A838BEJ3_9HYPH|nr:hypothetical protein [Mesorhizobium neociceri]MBA1144998.1 hypothetical protein [Mesorhizobium neociceri]